MNKKLRLFKDYMRIKRADDKLKTALETSGYKYNTEFTCIAYVTNYYREQIGPDFESMELMYSKIKESV